jgi:Fe-S-cluster containining protein
MTEEQIPTLPAVDWALPADDPLTGIERQIERGSQFTQASLDKLLDRVSLVEQFVMGLAENLRETGALPLPEAEVSDNDEKSPISTDGDESPKAEADPPQVATSLEQAKANWPGIAFGVEPEDPEPPVEVNCAERMHVCHAVCCKLNFALTPAEVESGKVKWDLGFPYLIRHGSNGYCVHNDTATGCCTNYANRPGACHRYSCAHDPRIWKDFDNMVLNEEWIRRNLSDQNRILIRVPLPLMEVKHCTGGGNGVAANGSISRDGRS